MRSLIPFYILAASALSSALVLPTDPHQFSALSATVSSDSELRQIQTSPLETRWVTEDQKLELKRVRSLAFLHAGKPTDLMYV